MSLIRSGPDISLSINASSSVFHAMEVVLDTQLADPLFETCTSRADDAGRTNWLDTSKSDDQKKTCIRTLDNPMYVTLDQPICPLYHSLNDPMFAVAVDVNWECSCPKISFRYVHLRCESLKVTCVRAGNTLIGSWIAPRL
jgi:hypothetical protein